MNLLERIKNAIAQNRVEYWEDRSNPPNLDRSDFDAFLAHNPVLALKRAWRHSGDGVHGLEGEDYVYHGDVTITAFGKTEIFYLKFFFWKKGDEHIDQGLEVQTFRKGGRQ